MGRRPRPAHGLPAARPEAGRAASARRRARAAAPPRRPRSRRKGFPAAAAAPARDGRCGVGASPHAPSWRSSRSPAPRGRGARLLPGAREARDEARRAQAQAEAGRPLPPFLANRADIPAAVKEFGGSRELRGRGRGGPRLARAPPGTRRIVVLREVPEPVRERGVQVRRKGRPALRRRRLRRSRCSRSSAPATARRTGRYKDAVQRTASSWLKEQQDAKGCFGTTEDYRYPYMHAMATLAMVENAILSGSTRGARQREQGLDYIGEDPVAADSARWRYAEKPPGQPTRP